MPARPTTFFPTDGLSSLSSSYRPRRSDLEIEKLSFQRGGSSDHPQSGKLRNYTIKGRQVFDLLHAGRETAVDTIRSKRRFVEIFKIDRARCQFLGSAVRQTSFVSVPFSVLFVPVTSSVYFSEKRV